jgi:NAD(P)-dependent dehydrogenase (short-subunit alcohol dehydrogenase family)
VAIVTGGSGGIGAAIVEAFAKAGASVVFTYNRNREAAEQVKALAEAQGVSVEYHQLALHDDVATESFFKNMVEKHGVLHSIIYAAGPGIPVDFAGKISLEDWKKTFDQDTHACFNLVHASLPILKAQGGGSICAITTTQATRHLPLSVLSSAPKAAIESLLEVVAKENGRYGIRANSIRSGWLAGGKLDRGMDGQMDDAAVQQIAKQVPLGCLGSPDDIADATVFLSSSRAKYISGVNLAVDGGWHI